MTNENLLGMDSEEVSISNNAEISIKVNEDTVSINIHGSMLDISTMLFLAYSSNDLFKTAVDLVIEYKNEKKLSV